VSTIERPRPPLNADERATLEGWLDFHRATLAMKCAGLSDGQAAVASVPHCASRALSDTGRFMEQEVSLRWIYVHMIEEYARHNGHADLVRERIDGSTGV
jgi:hypothetical protein